MSTFEGQPIVDETDCAICGSPVDRTQPHARFSHHRLNRVPRLGSMHIRCIPIGGLDEWLDVQATICGCPPPRRV